MSDVNLVDRLAALPKLEDLPHEELEWLVDHGHFQVCEAGTVLGHKGKHVDKLWIILSGHVAVQVDRGSGPRLVMEWRPGEVGGMLPYSRMKGPPGDNYTGEESEVVLVYEKDFPEMIHRCPVFTAYLVHLMLDRARSFSASDLQDEKMASLGKLAAGLAHELNNPAAAAVRSAKMLVHGLIEADEAARKLGAARLSDDLLATVERVRSACVAKPTGSVLSSLEQADREDEIIDWLEEHDLNLDHAQPLAATAVSIEDLDQLAEATSNDLLASILLWIATGCTTRSLAIDIEQAATRISDLVAAIKRFTYMDHRGGSDRVDVEAGLRDTIRIVAAKARAKGAAIDVDIEPGLPRVKAVGGELNQVWLNLVDNALDAIPDSGRIEVSARLELDRVVVRVCDNGSGIPPDVQSRIFDPFFTTKPPGQGTGLGLDIARRLLRQYRGEITVQSRPGQTEFRVSLLAEKT